MDAARRSAVDEKKQRRNARDRSRSQLKKTTMEAMRQQVEQLEATKRKLEQRFPSLGVANTPQPLAQDDSTKTRLHDAQAQYLRVLEIERLRQANRTMALEVLARDLFRSAVQNTLDACTKGMAMVTHEDGALPPRDMRRPTSPSATPPPPPMADSDASAFARRVVRQIGTSWLESAWRMQRFSGARVFGWSDFRMRTDATVHFTIKKTFPHQAGHLLAKQSFDIFSDIARLRRLLPPNIQCELREVQRVGEKGIVFDRVTSDREFRRLQYTALRTTYMLTQSIDDHGNHCVGMKTIDLPAFRAALADHESWCDIFYWFHFQDIERDTNGDPATVVVFGGALSYFTESIARAWLAELVFLAVRWESTVVAPALIKV